MPPVTDEELEYFIDTLVLPKRLQYPDHYGPRSGLLLSLSQPLNDDDIMSVLEHQLQRAQQDAAGGPDAAGATPLPPTPPDVTVVACNYRYRYMVALLERGACPFVACEKGNTLFHYLAKFKSFKFAGNLIKYIVDTYGEVAVLPQSHFSPPQSTEAVLSQQSQHEEEVNTAGVDVESDGVCSTFIAEEDEDEDEWATQSDDDDNAADDGDAGDVVPNSSDMASSQRLVPTNNFPTPARTVRDLLDSINLICETPLRLAVCADHLIAAKYLLQSGCDVDFVPDYYRDHNDILARTLLMSMLCNSPGKQMTALLLQFGASTASAADMMTARRETFPTEQTNPNMNKKSSITVPSSAWTNSFSVSSKKKPAAFYERMCNGFGFCYQHMTPLHFQKSFHQSVVDCGADIGAKDKSGATPIVASVRLPEGQHDRKHVRDFKLKGTSPTEILIREGADICAPSGANGFTPLMVAVGCCHYSAVGLILALMENQIYAAVDIYERGKQIAHEAYLKAVAERDAAKDADEEVRKALEAKVASAVAARFEAHQADLSNPINYRSVSHLDPVSGRRNPMTALEMACEVRQTEIIEALLDIFADPRVHSKSVRSLNDYGLSSLAHDSITRLTKHLDKEAKCGSG